MGILRRLEMDKKIIAVAVIAAGFKQNKENGTWSCVHTIQAEFGVHSVAVSSDNRLLAVGGTDPDVNIYDLKNNCRLVQTLSGHINSVTSLAWNRYGQLASGHVKGEVKIWNSVAGLVVKKLSLPDNSVAGSLVAWNNKGTELAVIYYGLIGGLKIWDVEKEIQVKSFDQDTSVYSVAWSPDGTLFALGGVDKKATIRNAATGEVLKILNFNSFIISSKIVWNNQGTQCAVACWDGAIILLDGKTLKQIKKFRGSGGLINSIAWNQDGTQLASGSNDNTVKIWNVGSGKKRVTLKTTLSGHEDIVNSVVWLDEKTIISGSWDETVKIWKLGNNEK